MDEIQYRKAEFSNEQNIYFRFNGKRYKSYYNVFDKCFGFLEIIQEEKTKPIDDRFMNELLKKFYEGKQQYEDDVMANCIDKIYNKL